MDARKAAQWVLGGLVLLAFPFIVPLPYFHNVAILILVWVVIGASWNLLGGYTGQVSFGHAAYFGVGAYAGALLFRFSRIDPPVEWFQEWIGSILPFFGSIEGMVPIMPWYGSPWWGLLIGGPAAVLIGLLIGWVCLRLRGPYFALGTLASGEILFYMAINLEPVTGGEEGIIFSAHARFMSAFMENPPIWTLKIPFYYLILAIAGLCLLTIHLVMRSKLGYYFVSIREDQDAAESLGIPTTWYKNISLGISAFFTGVAGAFYGLFLGYTNPHVSLGLHHVSIMAIMVVMVGGTALRWGPIWGAAIMVGVEEIFRSGLFGLLEAGTKVREYVEKADVLVFGLIVIVVILFMPNGVAGDWRKLLGLFKRRPKRVAEA
ncbi:MAG: branched-chain amino acid ABC transporter permease [Proteobacteria bacterium]|nr:branched-chain amino acid ABC transporter permease [Pseudomonadota bacterium]MBU1740651.1 branched-chain amino acid ABC transporter permease [Pseudomonadota bacterium]